ncbi:3-oxoacyl-[acyl-carrier-protein] reductase FabG [Arthrobacter sp. Hiyo8]|nr:3-oxoacyl-[acyl-carrier-protein] reductase FabG [Arthrobacter sp. Hiyo8]
MRGTFLVSQAVLKGMIERRVGRIVCISSISAQRGAAPSPRSPTALPKEASSASPGSGREVGEHGVTVNCVAPGPIDTDIMGGTLTEERKSEMSQGIMMGRVGTREEVAALMSFLLGADAGYITAATYDINGGLQVS